MPREGAPRGTPADLTELGGGNAQDSSTKGSALGLCRGADQGAGQGPGPEFEGKSPAGLSQGTQEGLNHLECPYL